MTRLSALGLALLLLAQFCEGGFQQFCSPEHEEIANAVMNKAEAHYAACDQPAKGLDWIYRQVVKKQPPNKLSSLVRDTTHRSPAHDKALRQFAADASAVLALVYNSTADSLSADGDTEVCDVMACVDQVKASVLPSHKALVQSFADAALGSGVPTELTDMVMRAAAKLCEGKQAALSSPSPEEPMRDLQWDVHMLLWELYSLENYHQHNLWAGPGAYAPRVHFNVSVAITHEIQHHMLLKGVTKPRMVEVGVMFGDGAEMALVGVPDLQYIGVDPYPDSRSPQLYDGAEYQNTELRLTSARLRLQQFGRRAQLLWANTAEVTPWIADGSLDYVFLDGDHAYETVVEELRSWIPKLRPGGIIAGHDYLMLFRGVITAVHEVFQEHPSEDGVLHLSPDNVFFWSPRSPQ